MFFWDFFCKSKNFHVFFWISAENPKKHMEIQNFQKFLGRPIVLEIWVLFEILDVLGNFGFPYVFLDFC